MWEKYYQLRSTEKFSADWTSFLQLSGAAASQTMYQHVTVVVMNHLIKKHFELPEQQATCTTSIPSLDYNERNALRYISGYITRTLYRKLKQSKHQLENELCLCLAELNDVDPDEMHDESNDWMKAVDRGGLKHVTNMTYTMFASAEIELRKHLATSDRKSEVNITSALARKDRRQ